MIAPEMLTATERCAIQWFVAKMEEPTLHRRKNAISPSTMSKVRECRLASSINATTAPAMVSGNEIPIVPLPSAGTLAMLTTSGEMRPLEEMESEIIRFAISHYRGQMSEVARRLKIGRSTLYRKLDALGLAPDAPNPDMVPL